MKKLLFVVAASFFSSGVYAQAETSATQYNDLGPKVLMCTEEAVSFRINIRPDWQLSSVRPGYTDFANGPSGIPSSKNYSGEDIIPEPVQLVEYENELSRQGTYPAGNFLFPEKTIKSLMQTSRFANDYFFYHYNNTLKSPNFNFLAPRLK